MNRFKILVLILSLSAFTTVFCQESKPKKKVEDKSSFGIFANLLNIGQTADFTKFPNIPSCCNNFDTKTASGLNFGLFYSMDQGFYDLQFRLNYQAITSDFSGKTNDGNGVDVNGLLTKIQSQYTLNSTFSSLNVTPMVQFKNLVGGLRINAGINIGMVMSGKFEQVETLINPSDAIFKDTKTNKRNEFPLQEIDSLNKLQINLMVGISYDINLKHNIVLSPEVNYYLALSSISKDVDWKMNKLAIGASIKYLPNVKPEIILLPGEQLLDLDEFKISLSVKGLDLNDKESDVSKFVVEEFNSDHYLPLLNYIFFDDNSYSLQLKYKEINETDSKNYNELTRFSKAEAIDVYYDLLNIIGSRMNQKPSSEITLIGCNSNYKTEANNKTLSQKRANTVKEYLVTKWGIAESRIKIEDRNLPDKPTQGNKENNRQENRRVEILSNDFDILKPILVKGTTNKTIPLKLKYYASANTTQGVDTWVYNLQQNESFFASADGRAAIDPTLVWNPNKKNLPKTENNLVFSAVVKDSRNNSLKFQNELPVEIITLKKKQSTGNQDKSIDEYLILSDLNSGTNAENNNKILAMLCKNTTSNSNIYIYSYTEKQNSQIDLSAQLQKNADDLKNSLNCSVASKNAVGMGYANRFDDSTPEGRFYSRSIEIRVEK